MVNTTCGYNVLLLTVIKTVDALTRYKLKDIYNVWALKLTVTYTVHKDSKLFSYTLNCSFAILMTITWLNLNAKQGHAILRIESSKCKKGTNGIRPLKLCTIALHNLLKYWCILDKKLLLTSPFPSDMDQE